MITYLPVGSKHHLSIQSPLAASIVECHMLRKKSEYHYMIAILPRHSYKSKYIILEMNEYIASGMSSRMLIIIGKSKSEF